MALEPFQVAAPVDDFIDPRLEKKNRQECGSKDLHAMDRADGSMEVVHKSLSGERTRPRVLVLAPSPKHVFKVRDRDGAITSTRGACAPQTVTPPRACGHAAAGAVPARRTPARKACETSPSLRC